MSLPHLLTQPMSSGNGGPKPGCKDPIVQPPTPEAQSTSLSSHSIVLPSCCATNLVTASMSLGLGCGSRSGPRSEVAWNTEGGKNRMYSLVHSIPRHPLTEPMLSWGPKSFQRESDLGPAPWNYYWRQQESCSHHAVYYPIPAMPSPWSCLYRKEYQRGHSQTCPHTGVPRGQSPAANCKTEQTPSPAVEPPGQVGIEKIRAPFFTFRFSCHHQDGTRRRQWSLASPCPCPRFM